ncbi:hypothetical protein MUP32_05055 [Candidatus Microgenomates bacterium]|nr:hypothetical protein [Candidatus Microgenomates bacterium]
MNKELRIKLVIFSIIGGKLQIFLPDNLLPVGKLGKSTSLDQTAKKNLEHVMDFQSKENYLEQLYTFSGKENSISVVYYALIPDFEIPESARSKWSDCSRLSKQLPDRQIISYAFQRLRWKIEYTNVVYSLLPEEFIFSQLQDVYEAILGKTLDKRNFRKKILSLKILKDTGRKRKIGRARPAEVYSFRKRKLAYVEVL